MATLVIAAQGTLGDHLPYIALGKRLQARGHTVRLAVNPAQTALAAGVGLETVPCGVRMGEAEARRGAADWNQWQPAAEAEIANWQGFFRREIPPAFAQLSAACAEADGLICGYQRHALGVLVAANTGIPWLATSVMPALHCAPPLPVQATLARALGLIWDEFAAAWGLQPRWDEPARSGKALLAASAHFATVNAANRFYTQTGFWFDAEEPSWQPEAALADFFRRFPAPLVLSFSSLPLQNPAEVLALHVRAAAQLGSGLIVQRGWADFNPAMLPDDCDPSAVWFADFIPHDGLFARAAAVIHHGGIGTIARALRQGCPMLVEPYGNDQFFNAQQVLLHQVGAAAHPAKISADGLARILERKVLTAHCRDNARMLGKKIRAENGLDTACDLIEEWFF